MTHPEILFDCYEYRTGVYLAKAYVVGRSAAGRLVHVHHAAKAAGLKQFEIDLTEGLARALHLVETLKPAAIAKSFQRSNKKPTALPSLLSAKRKGREEVIRYIHHRMAELLTLCKLNAWPVTLNLRVRAEPEGFRIKFPSVNPTPRLSFELTDTGCYFRFTVLDPTPIGTAEQPTPRPIRYFDWKVITNHPSPGWLVMNDRLVQLGQLNGNHVKPFLSREHQLIAAEDFETFFREVIVRVARHHPIHVIGFAYELVDHPGHLRLSVKFHPFEHRYLLYPEFAYGDRNFAPYDAAVTAVDYSVRPAYRIIRTERDPAAEADLLLLLSKFPLHPLPSSNAFELENGGNFGALEWMIEQQQHLIGLGIEVVTPEKDGHKFVNLSNDISLNVSEQGDWLDLTATVTIGAFTIPFARIVKFLQRDERCFPLPDGTLFLIPEAWFTKYGPGLRFATVQGDRVRVTRAQSPLLGPLGLTVATDHEADDLATTYAPSDRLKATLRPYQLAGVRWLIEHYHRRLGACLADDMGLGKTLQTIAVLLYAKEQLAGTDAGAEPAGQEQNNGGNSQMDLFAAPARDEDFLRPLRALVILPASLIYNWRHELTKFAPTLTVQTHTGPKRRKDARIMRRFDVTLTTYQTALRDEDFLRNINFTYIVLDESQQIKNRSSKIFKALNRLSADHRISLSGTPIENSLSDLWSQMQFTNPGLLRGFAFFKREFIEPIEGADDEERKTQLRKLVAPHLLRRTKAEVAPDLPALEVQLYYCDMTPDQAKAYERERSAARNALLGNVDEGEGGAYRMRVIQSLTRLRQLANHPSLVDGAYSGDSGKFKEVLEQWETVRRSGQKVLIFSSLVSHLELFRDHLRKLGEPYAWLTGSISSELRAKEVARFQTDATVGTFFISIKAGGTGLNLTAADYVFILDPWWNPSTEDQAIARAHRIGRAGNVFARKFITRGTIEEKINELQRRKKRLSDDIIGDGERLRFGKGDVKFLLRKSASETSTE